MDVRQVIWEKRLDAKANVRYFGDIEDRYTSRARLLQFVGLASGSGSIVSLSAKLAPLWAISILGAIAAVSGSVLIAYRYADIVASAKAAVRHWVRREMAWDLMWFATEAQGESVDLRRIEGEIRTDREFDAPQVKWDSNLALQAERETRRALGLPSIE